MSHDYEPSWDYPVVELETLTALEPRDREQVKAVLEKVESTELCALMGFSEGFQLFHVEPMGLTGFAGSSEVLGVYCNGTSSRPVVGIDLTLLKTLCDERELSLEREFAISLAHELAHAYQETLGQEEYGVDDEDEAETFGRAWADTGRVDLAILQSPRLAESNRG